MVLGGAKAKLVSQPPPPGPIDVQVIPGGSGVGVFVDAGIGVLELAGWVAVSVVVGVQDEVRNNIRARRDKKDIFLKVIVTS